VTQSPWREATQGKCEFSNGRTGPLLSALRVFLQVAGEDARRHWHNEKAHRSTAPWWLFLFIDRVKEPRAAWVRVGFG